MGVSEGKTVVARMHLREKKAWTPIRRTKGISKRLLRNTGIFAAVSLCISGGAYLMHKSSAKVQSVIGHLTAGFEYDETLGRLQYVSSLLPESAMVFLNDSSYPEWSAPTYVEQTHTWSAEEPWVEYACTGDISACDGGEILTVMKNSQNEYTVRILHDLGYESLYSGLSAVNIKELDQIEAGQRIGSAAGFAAFEIRKDGLSVMPVFAVQ